MRAASGDRALSLRPAGPGAAHGVAESRTDHMAAGVREGLGFGQVVARALPGRQLNGTKIHELPSRVADEADMAARGMRIESSADGEPWRPGRSHLVPRPEQTGGPGGGSERGRRRSSRCIRD
ncbi:hypothetical protein GCM10010207_77980 [Streptomyces atratus]|nr:hypothetical protein GCM10010207_77980 [Streptomyces atratus]